MVANMVGEQKRAFPIWDGRHRKPRGRKDGSAIGARMHPFGHEGQPIPERG